MPFQESKDLYARYKALADAEERVSFVGRLATYRYYNMDQVVGMALVESEKIIRGLTESAPQGPA